MAARPAGRQAHKKPADAKSKVRIGFAKTAHGQFLAVSEKERSGLEKLQELARHPRLGKPLLGELKGYVRISFGRLRCVVKCAKDTAVVLVLVIPSRAQGSRRDVYELAKRALADPSDDVEAALQGHIAAHIAELRTLAPRPSTSSG